MPATTPWKYGSGAASHAALQIWGDHGRPLACQSAAQHLSTTKNAVLLAAPIQVSTTVHNHVIFCLSQWGDPVMSQPDMQVHQVGTAGIPQRRRQSAAATVAGALHAGTGGLAPLPQ